MDQVGHARDGVERGTDFMRHIGEEGAFCQIRRLGYLPGCFNFSRAFPHQMFQMMPVLFQFGFVLFAFGNVVKSDDMSIAQGFTQGRGGNQYGAYFAIFAVDICLKRFER